MKANPMRALRLEKVVLHCSTSDPDKLKRCMKLLELITGQKATQTLAKKRVPAWKIRPGIPVGCKVTLGRKKGTEILKRLFEGVKLSEKNFTEGQLAFGVKEYIEIPSIPFQRELGILGFDVLAKLERPGFRVARRKRARARIPVRHRITKAETFEWFKRNFTFQLK